MHKSPSTGLPQKTYSFGQNGMSVKGVSSKLLDIMRQRNVQSAQIQPRYSSRLSDTPVSGIRMNSSRSNQHLDGQQNHYTATYSTRDQIIDNQTERLLEEANQINHVRKDFSYMPSIKNTLDASQISGNGLSIMPNSVAEIRRTVEECERQKYSDILKRQLMILLQALDFQNPQSLLGPEPSMEYIALEIRRKLQNESKSPLNSSRIIKKTSQSIIDDPDESAREIRRLKELVVKLQNEINANMKKSLNERIVELYDDNQNYQRKVADLIDQLKRKEQEILLVPVGKIAQHRIDSMKKEVENYKRKYEEQKKLYEEEISLFQKFRNSSPYSQNTEFFPKSNDTYLDPSLLQTVIGQKQIIAEQNTLIVNLRDERSQLENNLRIMEDHKLDFQRKVASYESVLHSERYDSRDFKRQPVEQSPRYVIETPRSQEEDRYELENQLDNLMALKEHLNNIKKEVNKGS